MNPRRWMVPAAMATIAALAWAWKPAAGREQDMLPGRTRPLLQTNWPLPRDLEFGANTFQPPDAKSSFVTTPEGVRAFIVSAADDPVVRITAALPLGRSYEGTGESGAAEQVSRLLTQSVRERLGRAFVGRLQVDQEVDATRLSLQTLPEDWRPGLRALVEALRQTSFAGATASRTGSGFAAQTRGLGGATFRPAVELARLVATYPLAPADPGQNVAPDAVIESRHAEPAS